MRCGLRGILTAAGLSVGLALGGCGSGGSLGSLDPSDWFDFDKEKPIPGERRAVFPEGVPGVPQGVPPELVRGNQPPPTDPAMVATAESDQPAGQPQTVAPAASTSVAARTDAEPKGKPRPATKPKPKVAARPKPKQPTKPAAKKQPPAQTTAQPAKPEPAAQPAQSTAQQSRAQDPIWGPHPTRGASAPWPAQAPEHTTTAPWPDAPNPNTFSR